MKRNIGISIAWYVISWKIKRRKLIFSINKIKDTYFDCSKYRSWQTYLVDLVVFSKIYNERHITWLDLIENSRIQLRHLTFIQKTTCYVCIACWSFYCDMSMQLLQEGFNCVILYPTCITACMVHKISNDTIYHLCHIS